MKKRVLRGELHKAAEKGDINEVQVLFGKKEGKEANTLANLVLQYSGTRQTPLHLAAKHGRVAVCRFLLEKGADVNIQDEAGWTCLHSACYSGNIECLSLLLQQEALLPYYNARNLDQTTPLHYFARSFSEYACKEAFKKLVNGGADVNAQNKFGETPLHSAVLGDNMRTAKLLLKARADPNRQTSKLRGSETPLHWATKMNKLELVKLLIKYGADVSIKSQAGYTSKDYALQKRYELIAQLLIKQEELLEWLSELGLQSLMKKFQFNTITLDEIPQLDDKTLDAMNIKEQGVRIKLLNPSEYLRTPRFSLPPPSPHRRSPDVPDDGDAATLSTFGLEPLRFSDLQFVPGGDLGAGFFGKVKKALWGATAVAVKIIHRKNFRDQNALQLFYKEVAILSKLRHANIVQFFGVCVEPKHCIVSEFMENGNLHSLLRNRNTTPHVILDDPKMRFQIAKDIASGMYYLHTKNPPIIHRDLTSANVLLDKNYRAKVTDFGLSKEIQAVMSGTTGALPWLAPEVFASGGRDCTTASDVFSFGLILWELLTGDPPQQKDDPLVFAQKVKNGFRPPIPASEEDTPYVNLVKWCWATKPKQRPTFQQIISELQRMSSDQSTASGSEIEETDSDTSVDQRPDKKQAEDLGYVG
jgi:ankyrin repeat protein/tRNA A-37 threonylcarbamoyl transferase component Bud32